MGGGRATLALSVLGAGLAALIAVNLLDGPPDAGPMRAIGSGSPRPVPAAGVPASQEAAATGGNRGQWAAAALSRPLFSRSRRPPAMPAAAPAAVAGLPRVAGIVVNGPDRSAILVPAEGGRPVVVREGMQAVGVTIQAIQAGKVTVLGADGTRILRPSPDPNRPVAAPAAAAPAPGAFPLFNGLPPPPPAGMAR